VSVVLPDLCDLRPSAAPVCRIGEACPVFREL